MGCDHWPQPIKTPIIENLFDCERYRNLDYIKILLSIFGQPDWTAHNLPG